jgi:hypothetical protein
MQDSHHPSSSSSSSKDTTHLHKLSSSSRSMIHFSSIKQRQHSSSSRGQMGAGRTIPSLLLRQ